MLSTLTDGSALIAWGNFASDLTRAAGVNFESRGYLSEEVDFLRSISPHLPRISPTSGPFGGLRRPSPTFADLSGGPDFLS